MKRHGNTLYITTQGAYVNKDDKNLVISVEQVVKMRVPIHTIASAVSFGNVMWTPHCLGLCGEHNVPVSFLSESGRLFARMVGPQSGSVFLRRAQHEKTRNPETMSQVARIIVSAKSPIRVPCSSAPFAIMAIKSTSTRFVRRPI